MTQRSYRAVPEVSLKARFRFASVSVAQTVQMRMPLGLVVVPLALLMPAVTAGVRLHAEGTTVLRFDGGRTGVLPAGIRVLSSSEKERGAWKVERVDRVLALGQTEVGVQGYRLAVVERASFGDVHAGARLRVGRGDRAAGLAWRVQDVANYYAARLDLDRNEVVVYKFVHGNRVRLARTTDVRLDPGEWHDLMVEHAETRIRVWLNGVPVVSTRDDSLREAGRLGFWMPGDGTAHFERLWYRALPRAQ
jgi:hypothetical protein